MTRPFAIVVFVGILSGVNSASANADVIWTFESKDPAATPVSGFITIGGVSSIDPGTTWTLADIVDYSFVYDGTEIASFSNPGLTTFFDDAAGLPFLEFTASTPYLPFVSTSFGDFRTLLVTILTFDPNFFPFRNFTIEGSTSGETFMFCFSGVIPNQPVCHGQNSDLVSLQWEATVQVPEPSLLSLLAAGCLSFWRHKARRQSIYPDDSGPDELVRWKTLVRLS